MTISPDERTDESPPEAPPAVRIVTLTSPGPERIPFATEEEEEDDRRRAALAAHFARRPLVTWVLMGAITAMFATQYALGGVEDPFVMMRLGALVPDDVRAGALWRLVSSAFLHAGVVHYGLNTYVLWVVGRNLERIIGSARFLVAYTLSVIGASLAALAFSDARLTVGASGGVFGLFGVEAVVVLLRPELLPTAVRQSHGRNVVLNLVINVAASFRPHVAMAAHFGGGLVGAALGLVLVPKRLPASPTRASWELPVAAISALLLAAGAGAGVVHAIGGGALGPPRLARTEIALDGARGVSAEIPEGLVQSEDETVTFGDLQRDARMVSFQLAVVDESGRLETERASRGGEAIEGLAFVGAREATLDGHAALVATYTASEAPLTLDRVLRFDPGPEPGLTTIWVVELAYWSSSADAHRGLAEQIAGSIEGTIATQGDGSF